MRIFKKTAITFAALSVVAAPVAASAASSAPRAASVAAGANELEGNSSWIIEKMSQNVAERARRSWARKRTGPIRTKVTDRPRTTIVRD